LNYQPKIEQQRTEILDISVRFGLLRRKIRRKTQGVKPTKFIEGDLGCTLTHVLWLPRMVLEWMTKRQKIEARALAGAGLYPTKTQLKCLHLSGSV
jgi:hypothetical protein